MSDAINKKEYYALVHAQARVKAHKSQDFMAAELHVSRKTVQNWERGISVPDIFQSSEWFRVLNTNPFPYYLKILYSTEFVDLNLNTKDEKVEEMFDRLVKTLPVKVKRQLLYMFYGEHGSSPNAVLQLILAHLHLPMRDRIIPATTVLTMYELEKDLDNLVCPNNIQPDIDILENAIKKGNESARNQENKYGVITHNQEYI